jgi:hypothetical protein
MFKVTSIRTHSGDFDILSFASNDFSSHAEYCFEQFPFRLVVVRFDSQDMIAARTPNTIPLQKDITFDTPLESIFIITSNVSTFTRLIEPTCVPA